MKENRKRKLRHLITEETSGEENPEHLLSSSKPSFVFVKESIVNCITFEILESIFSEARIAPYKNEKFSPNDVLSHYHRNILLSESLFPTLHYFEICFRNKIDQVLISLYGENWLIAQPKTLYTSPQNKEHIKRIYSKLQHHNKNQPSHNDVLAQMTFGFWVSFFQKRYDPSIWHRKYALKIMFPNILNKYRKRNYLEEKLLTIKSLRNRIAHHEPIANSHVDHLHSTHAICHTLIGGMSSDALSFLQRIDRFPQTYKRIFPKKSSIDSKVLDYEKVI